MDVGLEWRKRSTTTEVILHASHTAEHEAPNLEQWLRVTGRKLGLLDIGYHFIVFRDGRHLCTRPSDRIGSHTPGYNKASIGVLLQGGARLRPGEDGEEIRVQQDDFTEAQRETVKFLYGYLCGVYGKLGLKGHTELGRHTLRVTKCPPLDMNRMREECNAKT